MKARGGPCGPHDNRELTQKDGWKTQDGRMTKKCRVRFLRHSAVLSLPAVLLRKFPNIVDRMLNHGAIGTDWWELRHQTSSSFQKKLYYKTLANNLA